MTTAPKLTRVQKKGQVTIPAEIRQRLRLAEGDLVAFIETEHGVMLVPQTVVPAGAAHQSAANGGEVNRSTPTTTAR
jgi:AbrB family looped-hinge helix DNA binding protein